MEKINFEEGTLVTPAKVTIDQVEYEVTPAVYEGNTPLSPFVLNKMQDNIEEDVDALEKIKVSLTQPTTGEDVWFRKSKNLFNKDSVNSIKGYFESAGDTIHESTSNTTIYIPCKENTTYTVSRQALTNMFCLGTTSNTPAVGSTIIDFSYIANNANTKLTVTTSANAKYLVIRCSRYTSDDLQALYNTIQIEEGTEATSYENYIEPSINVKNSTGGYEEFIKKEENIYSIGENKIGTWIDGSPIYRKVINWGSLPNQANVNKAHNISNLKSVISIKGIADDGNYFLPLPFASTVATESIMLYASKTNITINTGTKDRSNSINAYITLEYTKTTD